MSKIEQPNFETMDIGKLRQYASFLNIPLDKTATKQDIIDAINSKQKGKATPLLADADTAVPPGHAKIVLHEDTRTGAKNFPLYLQCNGYVCTIPRGKEVIVPMRVVRTLIDAKSKQPRQTGEVEKGQMVTTWVTVPSHPFTVVEMTPGPEPLTSLELSKKKTAAPRRKFRDQFGYYPKPGQLTRAIENGLIKLADDEELPPEEETFAQKQREAAE